MERVCLLERIARQLSGIMKRFLIFLILTEDKIVLILERGRERNIIVRGNPLTSVA